MPSNLFLQGEIDTIIAVSPMDSIHDARPTIDIAHHEIHEGKHFTASVFEGLSAASTLSILLTAPSVGSAIMHFTASIYADGSGVYTWSEAPNASAGTVLVEFNNDRGSVNAATLITTADPTYVSSGTILLSSHLGTNAPSVNLGGTFAHRQEWILASDILYLLRFTADGASCRTVIVAEWYEE